MKIAHIADIHISDTRIGEFEELLVQLKTSVLEQQPDVVVFAGDLFVHRDKLTPKQVELGRVLFKEYFAGLPVLIIPGNHDTSMSEHKIDSLSAIFYGDADINIHTNIGDYKDIDTYRFHFFPYPSKKELVRFGLSDVSDVYLTQKIFDQFKPVLGMKNILVYHGVLESIIPDAASERIISIGKDLIIPKEFWTTFDAVFAGHLHKYKTDTNAVYCGCPFPLTYADDTTNGYVIWENLQPRFIELKKLYPYITLDAGKISPYSANLTGELICKIARYKTYDFSNARVRLKYAVYSSRVGEVDHSKLSVNFKGAKEVKIVPECIEHHTKINDQEKIASLYDFQTNTISDLITHYINRKEFSDVVKKIAADIEKRIIEKEKGNTVETISFKPQTLIINNFKGFGPDQPQIDFTKLNHVIGVFGRNKAGKSTLIESIIWALFGTTLRNKDIQSVIRHGESKCDITLEFISNNTLYKIIRTRTLKSSSLRLYQMVSNTYADISGSTATDTQAHIERLVGSLDIFVSTIYSPQNKIDLLVTKSPADRKKIILDCLQIDALITRQKEVIDIKKKGRDKLNVDQGKFVAFTERLTELNKMDSATAVQSFTEQAITTNTELQYVTQKLTECLLKHTEYKTYEEEHKRLTDHISLLVTRILEVEKILDKKYKERSNLESLMINRDQIEAGLRRTQLCEQEYNRYVVEKANNNNRKTNIASLKSELKQREDEFDARIDILKQSKQALINQVEQLKLIDCPKADCPINAQVEKQRVDSYTTIEKVQEDIDETVRLKSMETSQIRNRITVVENELANSFFDKSLYLSALRSVEQEKEQKWEEQQIKVASGNQLIEALSETILLHKEAKHKLVAEKRETARRCSELSVKISQVIAYEKEVNTLRTRAAQLQTNLDHYNLQVARHKSFIEEAARLNISVLEQQQLIDEMKQYLTACELYFGIVSKTGVLFSLVDKALPILERFAQKILLETTNGGTSLSLEAYKTTTRGEKIDSVSIMISDNRGIRDVNEASGAELVLVSLALRAAMANLLSSRFGNKVDLFIVDEGMGALDDENIIVVKNMFKILGELFNKVLFITHITELKDIAQSIIKIEAGLEFSTYTIADNKD